MKKGFWFLTLALPAFAFAAPSLNDMIEAYKEKRLFFEEVLSRSTSSPDNIIKRYTAFRTSLYTHLPEYVEATISFPWGEPIFFMPEDFAEAGEGWIGDLEEALTTVGTNPRVPAYALWVWERFNEDDGSRQWVISARDKSNNNGLGEDLYEVDVDPGYAPHGVANALLKAKGITPTRDNQGRPIASGEGMFMTWFYNILDPARLRMAVNLMDYNDFLLLQNPGIRGDDDDDNVTPPPVTPPATVTTPFDVASLPYTNSLAFAAVPSLDIYTLTNSTAGAYDTYFYITNASPRAISISWATNSVSVPAGQYSLAAWREFETNVVLDASVKISVSLPVSSTNHWYGLVWENPLDWLP